MNKFLVVVAAVLLFVMITLSGCSTVRYEGKRELHPGHPGHEVH